MSASNPAAAWHSVHVHYGGRQEALLTDCIAPLVAAARTRGLSRWFFLRYWKGGTHVRVRCQFETAELPPAWDALTAAIGEYLRQNPSETQISVDRLEQSQRLLAALEGEAADAIVIYPNNTVVSMPYEPEYGKYGGPVGIALAESFFEASSDLAITTLRDIADAPKRRLNMAFAMMLASPRAAGYDERDTIAFFAAYARFCERFVPADEWRSWQAKVQRPEVLQQFSGATAVADGSRRYPPWLERWATTFEAAAKALHGHVAQVAPAVTLGKKMDPLQFVLFNYLHTHNNRLGMTPALEAQFAYLAHHVVAQHVGAATEDVRA